MSKKIDFKKIGMVIGGGLAGIAAAKLATDNTKSILKDEKIRKVAMPAAVVVGAVFASLKFPKYSDIIVGAVAGAGILLTGGVMDYMERSDAKKNIFALAGDGSQEIEFGSFEEMQDYVASTLPKQEVRLLAGVNEELDGDDLNVMQAIV